MKAREKPMTVAELEERARSMFGERWTLPMAKATNVTSRTMRNYKAGVRPVPADIAVKVRAISALGTPGIVIRRAIQRVWSECPPYRAHMIARQAEEDLSRYRLLVDGHQRTAWTGRQP
jgi:hypothetical protein